MKQIFFTFVATTLFWFGFYRLYTKSTEAEAPITIEAEQPQTEDVARLIDRREPVEEAEPIESKSVTPQPSKATSAQPNSQSKPRVTSSEEPEQQPQAQPKEGNKSVLEALYDEVVEKVQETRQQESEMAIVEDLFGRWEPVEGAKWPLEFTRYGTVIQYPHGLAMRYDYSTQGEQMKIRYDQARFAVVEEQGVVYLDLYNTTDFSGRYKKVAQPRKISMERLGQEEYPTLIVGRWTPVNGQQWEIEFTKFGTMIQYPHGVEMRYDYELNGNQAKMRYDQATVVISEDRRYYYLEIYDATDFSGRYKRAKQ